MQQSRCPLAGNELRRLVLGAALAAGLAVALAPHALDVGAAELSATVNVQADAARSSQPPAAAPDAAANAAKPSKGQTPAGATEQRGEAGSGAGNSSTADNSDSSTADNGKASSKSSHPGNHGIFIEEGGKKIRIEGLGGADREYDSFDQFVQKAPRIAIMFFITLMILFLLPLLIVVLLVWYKLRKNRLANETMLKLAERGVVHPATAMDAVASGNAASVAASVAVPPPGVPAYEQARYLRRRVVWSDLRKGVILTAVGIGLNFWSMFDDGNANGLGLVLLFLGIGYCVLWFFEDRTTAAGNTSPPPGSA